LSSFREEGALWWARTFAAFGGYDLVFGIRVGAVDPYLDPYLHLRTI
jgi:hypothetical protein